MEVPTNVQKWIDALRSSAYAQARLQLRQGDTFCCLGVACDLFHKETKQGEWSGTGFNVNGMYSTSVMTFPVWNWLDSDFQKVHSQAQLSNMNDDGKSFAEIADFIEAQYKATPPKSSNESL